MSRFLTVLTATLTVLPLLACGGVVVPDVPAVSVAPAHPLCTHLAAANEAPCTAVPYGETVAFAGLEVRAVSVQRIQAGAAASYEERQAMKAAGGTALAVVVEVTNPGPVKATHDFGVSLYTADGELRFGSPGAAEAFAKQQGLVTAFDFGGVGPGRSKRVAHVFAVPASELDGAQLYFQKVEYKPDPKDPRGRRRNFVVDQAIIDLPAPAID